MIRLFHRRLRRSCVSGFALVGIIMTCIAASSINAYPRQGADLQPKSVSDSACVIPSPDDSVLVGVEGDLEIHYREKKVPRDVMYAVVRELAAKVNWSSHRVVGLMGTPSMRSPVLGGPSDGSPRRESLTALVEGWVALEVRGDGAIVSTSVIQSTRDSTLDAALLAGIAALDSSRALTPLMRALHVKPKKTGKLNVSVHTVTGPAPSFAPHPQDPPNTSHASWRIAEVWQPVYNNDVSRTSLKRQRTVEAPYGVTDRSVLGEVVVDERGRAVPETFRTYFGDPRLVEAIRRSLRSWEYQPAQIGGCRVPSYVSVGA